MTEAYKEKCREAIELVNNLKITEKEILDYVIRHKEPISHTNIAEDLGLSYSTVVRTLAKLQKLQIIDKQPKELGTKRHSYVTNFAFSRKIYFALKEELAKNN